MGTGREAKPSAAGHAEVLAMDAKAVQMKVAPAKGDLESVMQIRQRLIGAQQQPAPDHRADAAQPGMKLIKIRSRHNPGRLSKHGTNHQPRFAPVSAATHPTWSTDQKASMPL